MSLAVLAGAIARVIKHRRRRVLAAEWTIVAHVNPASPGVGLALGQNRHGGVVTVQALGREDMGFKPSEQRRQHRAAGADLIGQGRQAEGHSLLGVALGLAVQWLMLPILLEQDHRQKAWTGPAPGGHMERRRRLAALSRVAAGGLFPGTRGSPPLPRERPQRS